MAARGFLAGGLSLCMAMMAHGVQAQSGPCRQALALGLDVSASVDAREYRLQLDGLAHALQAPKVASALLAMPSAPVHLLIYEWSGSADQQILVDWTAVRGPADIAVIADSLAQVRRRSAAPGTALGPAMRAGAAFLERRAACWKRTLDISGDGMANSGPRPETVKPELAAQGITVNALVIGADAPGSGDLRQAEISALSAYFRAHVITGPDAFVQTALGYEEYAQAMARKLARELEGRVLSALGRADRAPQPVPEPQHRTGPPQ